MSTDLSPAQMRRLVAAAQGGRTRAANNEINREFFTESPASRPTPEMQSEAWRRNAAARPLTAWLMGDPPPGQSALDRREL